MKKETDSKRGIIHEYLKETFILDIQEMKKRVFNARAKNEKFNEIDPTFQSIALGSQNISTLHLPEVLKNAHFNPPQKVWPQVNSFEEFGLALSKRINQLDGYEIGDKKLNKYRLALESAAKEHFDEAGDWISEYKMDRHRGEILYHYVQLLPAMVDPKKMREIKKIKIKRLEKIRDAIETLNNFGILADDISFADRTLWNMVRRSVNQRLNGYAEKEKFLAFQPQLTYLSRFLTEVGQGKRGSLVYNLFNRHNLIKDLYESHHNKSLSVTERKRRILKRLGSDLRDMSNTKRLKTLMKYTIP